MFTVLSEGDDQPVECYNNNNNNNNNNNKN